MNNISFMYQLFWNSWDLSLQYTHFNCVVYRNPLVQWWSLYKTHPVMLSSSSGVVVFFSGIILIVPLTLIFLKWLIYSHSLEKLKGSASSIPARHLQFHICILFNVWSRKLWVMFCQNIIRQFLKWKTTPYLLSVS